MSMSSYELKALRCVKCGAPLPEQLSRADYIKCEFCGYTQKLVDMREYLDKLRGEIYNWVKSIVPPSVVVSQMVDPMARHNIFIFNIKPKILGDYASIRSKLSTQLTHALFILPFHRPSVSRLEDPKRCFESLARVQSLEAMAVVDEDKSFLDDVEVIYETYAYIINAFDLILNRSDLSFLIKNFEQAAASLEKLPSKTIEYKRMLGVTEAYRAVNEFLKGDLKAAKQLMLSAIRVLEDVAKEARKSTTTAVMVPSTAIDISTLKTLDNIIETGFKLFEAGRSPTELLPYLSEYFNIVEELRTKKGSDIKIYEELSGYLRNIVEAKIAANHVEMLPGSGNLLFPLWIVSVTYTFATGVLLWKKGKEMEDRLLVAATVPLATQPVTDVFGVSAGFMDKLAGKETTLSTGFISNVITQAKKTSIASSVKVIPPLTTKEDSERVAETYLSFISQKMGGKIKFGTAHSLGLIYATAEIRGNDIYVPSLGNSQIKLAPYLEQLLKIAF